MNSGVKNLKIRKIKKYLKQCYIHSLINNTYLSEKIEFIIPLQFVITEKTKRRINRGNQYIKKIGGKLQTLNKISILVVKYPVNLSRKNILSIGKTKKVNADWLYPIKFKVFKFKRMFV